MPKLTDDEVVAKFHRMADGVISQESANRIIDQAWKLDEMDDVTPLFSFEVEG